MYSKNLKLNAVLDSIACDLKELGVDEVKRYMKEFPNEVDYNIYSYGNVLVYNDDIRNLYKDYKSMARVSDDKMLEVYKRQVGYMARELVKQQ